jgi:hypothetical protein
MKFGASAEMGRMQMMPRRNAASENESVNADCLTTDDATRLMMKPGAIDPGSESESDEEEGWPRRRGYCYEK